MADNLPFGESSEFTGRVNKLRVAEGMPEVDDFGQVVQTPAAPAALDPQQQMILEGASAATGIPVDSGMLKVNPQDNSVWAFRNGKWEQL